jgi:hypothetical protein
LRIETHSVSFSFICSNIGRILRTVAIKLQIKRVILREGEQMALVVPQGTFFDLSRKSNDLGTNFWQTVVQNGTVAGTRVACFTFSSFLSSFRFQLFVFCFVTLSLFIAIILFLRAISNVVMLKANLRIREGKNVKC